jgi:hypothetical protein
VRGGEPRRQTELCRFKPVAWRTGTVVLTSTSVSPGTVVKFVTSSTDTNRDGSVSVGS